MLLYFDILSDIAVGETDAGEKEMSTYQTVLIPLPKQKIPENNYVRGKTKNKRMNNEEINSILSRIE